MDHNLAKEMARMKIVDEKRKREIEKICHESEELKELQNKIRQAYLNKERAAQIAETQYRNQDKLVSIFLDSNRPKNRKRTPRSKSKCFAATKSPSRWPARSSTRSR